jgi:putative glutamine amidotransferase
MAGAASGDARPVIGVSAYEEEAAWGLWRKLAAVVPSEFVRELSAAGADVVVLPVQATGPGIDSLVARLDGLLIVGGPDVDPELYGEELDPRSQPPRPSRDAWETALVTSAGRLGVPTLAVCRGMQLLNVVRGGTLHQHLPDVVGHSGHNPTPGVFSEHVVTLAPESSLRAVLGWSERAVPTHHHQGIALVGTGLRPAAWAEDGTVEALEDPDQPFLLAVQWHPEAGDDPGVFRGLVSAARERAATRAGPARAEEVVPAGSDDRGRRAGRTAPAS